MKKRIFLTGGAGYIGSHTCIELLKANHDVFIFDNLSNSSIEAVRRVELLTNRKPKLVVGDVRDKRALKEALSSFRPNSVIHFAGLKSVEKSVSEPILYYDVNVQGSLNLLEVMSETGCHEIVFSSSATVYGEKHLPPYNEAMPVDPVSPYGRTKLMFEMILKDWVNCNPANRAVTLRYFNPVGAHASGLIGENPKDTPNNLMPLLIQTVQKKRSELLIYGSDYDTRDGTGERDYIHVCDLAEGHLKAITNINKLRRFQILNLGSGQSTTVKELIDTFEKTNGVLVNVRSAQRRSGDVAQSFADPKLAQELIGFKCKKSLSDMCYDVWNWVQKNPDG